MGSNERAAAKKPRKASLDPERVVRAAFEVLEAEGLDNLTVRRIADRLGVQNPALYWHFQNKQAIIDRMAERMLADAQVEPAPSEPWHVWMLAVARSFRRVMMAHRDGARVVASADLSQSPMLPNVERALSMLTDAGFEGYDALIGILALFDYTLGATLEEQADPVRNAPPSERPAQGPSQAPKLAALLAMLATTGDGETTFEGGVRLLLDGLATRQNKRDTRLGHARHSSDSA